MRAYRETLMRINLRHAPCVTCLRVTPESICVLGYDGCE